MPFDFSTLAQAAVVPIGSGVIYLINRVNAHEQSITAQTKINDRVELKLDAITQHVIDIKGAIGYGKSATFGPLASLSK